MCLACVESSCAVYYAVEHSQQIAAFSACQAVLRHTNQYEVEFHVMELACGRTRQGMQLQSKVGGHAVGQMALLLPIVSLEGALT